MPDAARPRACSARQIVIDPRSPEQIENPYPLWELARRECPVFFSDELGVWVVTRYEDVFAVLRDPRRFVSRYSFDPAVRLPPEVEAVLAGGWENYIIVNIDRPEHKPLRKAINRVLTRSAVTQSIPVIHGVANELVDGFASAGRVDIATEFARPLPALVVGEILGIPRDEVSSMLHWGHDFQTILAGIAPRDDLARAAEGLVDYQRYFVDAIESRRTNPRDDFLTTLVQEFDADPELDLTTEKLANIPLAVFTAGHNTTSAAICNGLFVLLRHPDSLAAIKADSALIPHAVEEILRYEPPFPFVRRTLAEDAEIDGVLLPKGSTVMLVVASANYDDCKFAEDPSAFDIRRSNSDEHLTFGSGIHFCPGGPLARREVAIALEVMLERLPNLGLVGYERVALVLSRGFAHLEIEWDV